MRAGGNERIQERAYAIWLAEGCPHGRDVDHWLQAEQELTVVPTVPSRIEAPAGELARAGAEGEAEPVKARKLARPKKGATLEWAAAADASSSLRKPRVRKTVLPA